MLDAAAANHMNMLLQVFNLLATHYDEQVEVFPDFVHIPDEIALIFDDVYVFVDSIFDNKIISSSQKAEIDRMNTLLDQMSKIQEMWTLEALKTSSQWQQVRVAAREILTSFNEEPHPPHLFWIQYLSDDNKRDA